MAYGPASQITDNREISGKQEGEGFRPPWAVLPHIQPGSAAGGLCAWCLAPLVHSKGKKKSGSCLGGSTGCSARESPEGQALAGAEAKDGLPILAGSFSLVWEVDLGENKNTFREPEGQVGTADLTILRNELCLPVWQ